ncbi:MAG TPA: TolC family protein, partial [Planctomycetota bacterium]|nr:TolC family protein [Planctomycetota bacterium]
MTPPIEAARIDGTSELGVVGSAGLAETRRGDDLARLSQRPLSLEELQAVARDRSVRGLLVRARIAGAEARTRQALAAFYPALTTRSEYVRLDDQIEFEDPLGGGTFIAQDDEVFSQTTTLGFLLWDGGGRGASWRASRASEEMVRAQAARELQLLDREVAQSYLSWAEALQESAVLAASVEALEGALERARSLEALGRATRSDVLVVEVELERTRYDMRRLRDIAADARDELTRLLSLPAEATLVEPAPRETESLL